MKTITKNEGISAITEIAGGIAKAGKGKPQENKVGSHLGDNQSNTFGAKGQGGKSPHVEAAPGSAKSRINITMDDKIKSQMKNRGWTQKDIDVVVSKGPTGKSIDTRRPNKTPDGLGRNDTATVYGDKNGHIVVNDRTGEIAHISEKNNPNWIIDSRITWSE